MIEGLKPYPAKKDTGVAWLGEIPAHWNVQKLKYWLLVNQSTLSDDTDPDYAFDYVDIGSVGTGRLVARPERLRFRDSPSRARRIIRSGDTIVSTVRTYLKAIWHAEEIKPGSSYQLASLYSHLSQIPALNSLVICARANPLPIELRQVQWESRIRLLPNLS